MCLHSRCPISLVPCALVCNPAKNAGELFGFDRTRNLSHQSAAQIAAAAQAHGQKDDFTALTLTRLATSASAATGTASSGSGTALPA